MSKTHNPFISELAAFGESKVLPNFDRSIWASILVRKETPEGVVKAINTAVGKVMKTPEARAALTAMGSVVIDT